MQFINLFPFRAPNNYGSNYSETIPRPDPISSTTTNSTMIPNEQNGQDKIGGDGYDSSKMKQSNWRLLGLGIDIVLQFK